MFSKATLVKYLHICWPLAVDITHNRERKAPNALIHWTAALLLLRRRKKASAQRALPYLSLCLFPPLFSISFVFTSVIQYYLFVQPLFLFTYVMIFQSCCSSYSFFCPNFQLFLQSPSNRSNFPSASRSNFPARCAPAPSHSSMSVQLPSLNPFPCHSPGQGRPPVSSLGGHEEKLARGSDNPLTPHLSSARGKSTLLIGGVGGASRGLGAGMEVVILVSGGSEVKRGRSHR